MLSLGTGKASRLPPLPQKYNIPNRATIARDWGMIAVL